MPYKYIDVCVSHYIKSVTYNIDCSSFPKRFHFITCTHSHRGTHEQLVELRYARALLNCQPFSFCVRYSFCLSFSVLRWKIKWLFNSVRYCSIHTYTHNNSGNGIMNSTLTWCQNVYFICCSNQYKIRIRYFSLTQLEKFHYQNCHNEYRFAFDHLHYYHWHCHRFWIILVLFSCACMCVCPSFPVQHSDKTILIEQRKGKSNIKNHSLTHNHNNWCIILYAA